MNFLSRIYCRIYQQIFHLAIPFLPYRNPKIIKLNELNTILNKENVNKLMIVTDKNLVANNILTPFLNIINIPYVIYDDVKPNPTIEAVERARDLYIKEKATGILAIGGGSVLDLAKICLARVKKPKKSIKKMEGLLKIRKKLPPLIAVPTTAGTGSETTLAAVITDELTKHKYPINDFSLIPHYAILEPTLTTNLPKSLTATTGLDALTHAVEAFIGHSTTRKTRKMSIEATKLIVNNLKECYYNPHNLVARENMLYAAYYAGIAFTISYVGYIHAIAHSLGGKYGVPHGLANAVIMPQVLEIYGKACYKKLAYLARISKISTDKNNKVAAKDFIDYLYKTNAELNIPKYLTMINKDDVKEMARYAAKEANPLYPCPRLFNEQELIKIYYKIGDINE